MLRSSVGSCNNLLGAIFRVCFVNFGSRMGSERRREVQRGARL